MEFWEKSVVWKCLYKTIYQDVQENIVIRNVTIFCVQTKVFGNIKFCCLIITPFVTQTAIFFQQFFNKPRKYRKFLKSTSWMSFINFHSFDSLFSEKKGKQNLRGLKICVLP